MRNSRSSLFGRCAAAAALSVGLMASTIAGPAAAHTEGQPVPADYVALGDSYAAGLGAGSYQNTCGQSPLGLPGLLDDNRKIELTFNATCSGAKAAANPTDLVPDVPEQLAGLVSAGAIGAGTDLVTVSAGGNDLDFGGVARICALRALVECQQAILAGQFFIQNSLAATLDELYGNLRAAAPDATIVVTGYPHLFSPESGAAAPLSVEAQRLFNAGTDSLNAVIKQNAEANGLQYVDVVKRFARHGIGTKDPWITFTTGMAFDDLHPNAEGYESGYFKAVRSAVKLNKLGR